MSKQQKHDNKDKKKKHVPPSENARAKMEYLELDEEEIEHRRQLDMKYRDRAQERREGLAADEELDNDEENLLIEDSDEEEETYTKTKGLDFDLLLKQKEKEARELLENPADRITEEETVAQKREIKGGFKTNLGANIHRILFKENTVKETRRNIFKSSNNCYEFDVDVNFGSTLPKLVIRTRDNKTEAEPSISMKIGDNVLGKINKIMTYIKTGKRPEPKKEVNKESVPKPKESIFNPISTLNMSEDDDDDEDSIFPGARKKIKADEGPKTAIMNIREETKQNQKEEHAAKGLFDAVRTAKDNERQKMEEEEDILGAKRIEEKNKQLIEELSRKKAEEKLQQLQSRDGDYYMECFIQEKPKYGDLAQQKGKGDGKNKKSKKKGIGKQVEQVTKIMNEKRAGGGGGGAGGRNE